MSCFIYGKPFLGRNSCRFKPCTYTLRNCRNRCQNWTIYRASAYAHCTVAPKRSSRRVPVPKRKSPIRMRDQHSLIGGEVLKRHRRWEKSHIPGTAEFGALYRRSACVSGESVWKCSSAGHLPERHGVHMGRQKALQGFSLS